MGTRIDYLNRRIINFYVTLPEIYKKPKRRFNDNYPFYATLYSCVYALFMPCLYAACVIR